MPTPVKIVPPIRVMTGPKQWLLQDDHGQVFYLDITAVEAIATVIRHIDKLGAEFEITIKPKG